MEEYGRRSRSPTLPLERSRAARRGELQLPRERPEAHRYRPPTADEVCRHRAATRPHPWRRRRPRRRPHRTKRRTKASVASTGPPESGPGARREGEQPRRRRRLRPEVRGGAEAPSSAPSLRDSVRGSLAIRGKCIGAMGSRAAASAAPRHILAAFSPGFGRGGTGPSTGRHECRYHRSKFFPAPCR